MDLRSYRRRRAVSVVAAAVALVGGVSSTAAAAPDVAGCALPDLSTVPTRPADALTLIVAYSFGYREPADPSRTEHEPGPVNEALAEAVVAARGARDIPVFAQSEIASVLRSRYAMDDVISIDGDVRPDGSPIYLSTEGVATKVAESRGSARDSDVAGVVAFQDHLWRATQTTAAAGFVAAAPDGVAMPDRYDPESAQPWTTGPERYLPVDYAGRLKFLNCG